MNSRSLSRRALLRGCGASMALPLLDAMTPSAWAAGTRSEETRRMVFIEIPLGLHTPHLFPKESGRNYAPTPYLEVLKEFRDDLTVFSGLSHPGVGGGHYSWPSLLTGAPGAGTPNFRNTISVDQLAAEQLGHKTRLPSLLLGGNDKEFGSWTRDGVQIPSQRNPHDVYATLFLDGSEEAVGKRIRNLRDARSVLDMTSGNAASLTRDLGAEDRRRLDEYFTAVRDLERNLQNSEAWVRKPKPKVPGFPVPPASSQKLDILETTRLMLDLVHLAFQTDSTRLVHLVCHRDDHVPSLPGVALNHHDLSHHGHKPEKLAQLQAVETRFMEVFRGFFAKLKGTAENGSTLLDRTMVFIGSNLGNASLHTTENLPILLAGGGFRHGGHVAFDARRHPPLCNLYVSMLQRLGLEVESFGTSTGPLTW